MSSSRTALFPALLKHWRGQRGLSQLDLALAADVSSRHVSFLETGRSTPSEAMVLRLAAALDVPLRHVNAMLTAAGFQARYPETEPGEGLPEEVASALALLKRHHEPFPLIVLDRKYDVVDLNKGALAVLTALLPDASASMAGGLNLARLTFAPDGASRVITNFDRVGRELLWRLHRELLADPDDAGMRGLLDEVLAMPTVSDDWREPDLAVPAAATMTLELRGGGHDLSFFIMVTAFQAPQRVLLDELRIETWFPGNESTADACHHLLAALG